MIFPFFGPSAAAVQSRVDARLSTLAGLLPETATPRLATATHDLRPFSVLPNLGGSSFLLVMNHPELDPQLDGWMRGIREKCIGFVNIHDRAKAVFQHVTRSFSPTRNFLLHPVAHWREAKWEKEPMVCLGMLVAQGVGACLPQSAALHLALQAVSVPSKIVMGQIREVCLDDEVKGEVYAEGLHAWVETGNNDGIGSLYDPVQQVHIEGVPRGLSRSRKTKHSRSSAGTTGVEYVPDQSSRIIGVQIPLTKNYLKDELPMVRGALELYARSL